MGDAVICMQSWPTGKRPKLKVNARPRVLDLYPAEYWELFELTLAGCPQEAMQAFRKTLIGKGKPLRAAQADASIRAAWLSLCGKEKPSDIKAAIEKYGCEDTVEMKVQRNALMYHRNGWPCIFTRRAGTEWPEKFKEAMYELRQSEHPYTLLEFDDTNVDRIAA
jgi:hypothetical protein